jgi:hypothetical protein
MLFAIALVGMAMSASKMWITHTLKNSLT